MTDDGRREFLKAGGAGLLLLLIPGRAIGEIIGDDGYDWEKHRWGYVVDTTKCIGCGLCVRACSRENAVPKGHYRTWVERYMVEHDGAVEIDSPDGGIAGFGPSSHVGELAFFVPKLCNHCASTPCTQVCPVGAAYTTKDGVVMVDQEHCIGCGYCVQACPYGSRFIDPTTHTASKCTLCYHRITKGYQPACVEICPRAARRFGDLMAPGSELAKYLRTHKTMVLKPGLLTKPTIQYVGLSKEVT